MCGLGYVVWASEHGLCGSVSVFVEGSNPVVCALGDQAVSSTCSYSDSSKESEDSRA